MEWGCCLKSIAPGRSLSSSVCQRHLALRYRLVKIVTAIYGPSCSNLCLGTMQFGWTADEASSFEVMDAFVGAGGTFIDTADIYSRWAAGNPGGVSEENRVR